MYWRIEKLLFPKRFAKRKIKVVVDKENTYEDL